MAQGSSEDDKHDTVHESEFVGKQHKDITEFYPR